MAFLVGLVHLFYVIFVILTPFLLIIGALTKNKHLCSPWIRRTHLLCVIFIMIQYTLNWSCPLTILENKIRGIPHSQEFIQIPNWFADGNSLAPIGWLFLGFYSLFILISYKLSGILK